MTRRVLHAVSEFLPRSETFVYTLVTGEQAFEASVLCHTRLHAAEFPFPRIHVVPKPLTKRAPAWWISELIARTTGRSPWRRAVEAMLTRLAPDVVHAHFGTVGGELVAITKAAGIPLVTPVQRRRGCAAVSAALAQSADRPFAAAASFPAEGRRCRSSPRRTGERTIIRPSIDVQAIPVDARSGANGPVRGGHQEKALLDAIKRQLRRARR